MFDAIHKELDGNYTDEKFVEAGCGTGVAVLLARVEGFVKIHAYDQDEDAVTAGIGAYQHNMTKWSESLRPLLPSPEEFESYFCRQKVDLDDAR